MAEADAALCASCAAPDSSRLVLGTATLWGASTWFPVGLAYLALLLTAAGLLLASDRKARWTHARKSGLLLFPILFLGWFLLSYVVGPRGELAHSMVFHSVRFVLTIALGLMLWQREARAALAGFAVLAAVMLAAIVLEMTVGGVPRWPGLVTTLDYLGNQSIRACLLMVVVAAGGLLGLLWFDQPGADTSTSRKRALWAVALITFLAALTSLAFYLQSRTAMVMAPVVLLGVAMHRYRNARSWAMAIILMLTLTVGTYLSSDNVRGRINQGADSLLADAKNGQPSSSWGLRFHFYKFSLQQAAEHPLLGAGPGSWKAGWTAWPDAGIGVGFANPHNDYLLFAAESGLPAMLFLFLTYFRFLSVGFRRRSLWGGIGLAVALVATLTTVVNAGMRDAVFGLSLVWLMAVASSAAASPPPTSAVPPN